MSEPVHDWDKVVNKNVRCEDNQSVGNIVAVDNDHIIVTSQGGMSRYRIPKPFVENYNGAEVIVKLPRIALGGFKMCVHFPTIRSNEISITNYQNWANLMSYFQTEHSILNLVRV